MRSLHISKRHFPRFYKHTKAGIQLPRSTLQPSCKGRTLQEKWFPKAKFVSVALMEATNALCQIQKGLQHPIFRSDLTVLDITTHILNYSVSLPVPLLMSLWALKAEVCLPQCKQWIRNKADGLLEEQPTLLISTALITGCRKEEKRWSTAICFLALE